MHPAAKILHENGIDFQHRVGFVLLDDHVANGQSADIATVLKVSRIQGVLPHFVENLASVAPRLEQGGVAGGSSSANRLIFRVLLRTSDNPVLYNLFHGFEN